MMKRVWNSINLAAVKAQLGISNLMKDEKGSLGIPQIGAIVAALVIIGFVVSTVSDSMSTWVAQVWSWLSDWVNDIIKTTV